MGRDDWHPVDLVLDGGARSIEYQHTVDATGSVGQRDLSAAVQFCQNDRREITFPDVRQILLPLLADLQTAFDETDRIAWFWPTFHLQCGAVLHDEARVGQSVPLFRLLCEVRRPGAPMYPWLSPLVSAEPLALSRIEYDRLVVCFDEVEHSPPPQQGIVLDGCPYEIRVIRGRNASIIAGNPPLASVGALAQEILDLALSRGRWQSTRAAFTDLQRYLS